MKTLRVYIDTSVVGGCHDEEFQEPSQQLLNMAQRGEIKLIVSELLVTELRKAPREVRDVLSSVPSGNIETVAISGEATELQKAYIAADVVGSPHRNDALHVALATVARADLIVSWNFKHIVHFDKIRGFNSVNLREGFLSVEIHSPLE
ncbi:MAG: PIN domain-containing protein, partial [Syntrophobacterales bacterium]